MPPQIQHNVKLNRQTTLATLYIYEDIDTYLEYPETGTTRPVGHLFRRDPHNWENPIQCFAYSLGKPSGQSTRQVEVVCSLLTAEDGSTKVPCVESHSTCQGVKACPMSDIESMKAVHVSASREDIKARLRRDRQQHIDTMSPTKDIFEKTLAFISALQLNGCRAPLCEPTLLSAQEEDIRSNFAFHKSRMQRGYTPLKKTCEGRLYLLYTVEGVPYIQCEHYSKFGTRDHYVQFIDDSYDLEYLEAYFNDDTETIEQIEATAAAVGYGPLSKCTTVTNYSAQRVYCPSNHRNDDEQLLRLEMCHLSCKTKFRVFEPCKDYRERCPYILVTVSGEHPHPVPLPQKTPPSIRSKIFQLLESLEEDLPDLTPRKFLRHPIVKSYLRQCFPDAQHIPTLIDLHVSLANRAHLGSYIIQAKATHFPAGTGWEGVVRMKEIQDESLPEEAHYVRRIISMMGYPLHEEDEPGLEGDVDDVRIVICMTPEGSRRLLQAQYLQSDMAFKRVVGFHEFELATFDRISNTSIVFCRVFVNRQTAAAHQRIFHEIEDIVRFDTGQQLRWRHLHAESIEEFQGMILLWTLDQHGGQAKGLGLHLQQLARELPAKRDLYEPNRLLTSLDPYDHLRRLVRLCYVHAKRNIQECNVSPEVRLLMRSLLCVSHPDWENTVRRIQWEGGKAGANWVQDKIRSKFAFAAICWERSYIPLTIWKAGDSNSNLIESVHADVNREGVRCTLLGGVKKGEAFDAMKMRTLEAFEETGNRPSYKSGHLSDNASKSIKRKFITHHNTLMREDNKIENQNKKVQAARDTLIKIKEKVDNLSTTTTGNSTTPSNMLSKATKSLEKSNEAFEKAVGGAMSLVGTGSGKIPLLLPVEAVVSWLETEEPEVTQA